MTPRWHIGAKDLRGAISAYAKRFDLLEVRVALGDSKEKTEPSLATLKRWRKAVPPHFDFAVVAGPHLSSAKAGDLAQMELDAARAAIDALQARCFVLRTPAEVTPTSLWRGRIGKIVERVPHDVTHFVWEPAGLGSSRTPRPKRGHSTRSSLSIQLKTQSLVVKSPFAHASARRDPILRRSCARSHRPCGGRAPGCVCGHRDGHGIAGGKASPFSREVRGRVGSECGWTSPFAPPFRHCRARR